MTDLDTNRHQDVHLPLCGLVRLRSWVYQSDQLVKDSLH